MHTLYMAETQRKGSSCKRTLDKEPNLTMDRSSHSGTDGYREAMDGIACPCYSELHGRTVRIMG
jgi:hypothetical protein